MALFMYLGCTSKGLVDYPRSTCLSEGAAIPLNLDAESWRRLFEAFAQLIAGTPSLMVHWPCLGACYANIVLTRPALRFDAASRRRGAGMPDCSKGKRNKICEQDSSAQTSTSSADASRALPSFKLLESTRRPSCRRAFCRSFPGRSLAHVSCAQPAHMHVDSSTRPLARRDCSPPPSPPPRAQRDHHCTLLCAHCSAPQLFLPLPPARTCCVA